MLFINEEKHYLLEIEFYFTNDVHPDPYTHCNPAQKSAGKWYFHVDKNKNGEYVYREEQFAGVDISIGDEAGGSGGILIRSVKHVKTNKIYCGPGQVMEHIVNLAGCNTVAEMVRTHFSELSPDVLNVDRMSSYMYLFFSDEKRKKPKIYDTPRIGLFLTKRTIDLSVQVHYMLQHYRFVTDVNLLWKNKHYLVYRLHMTGVPVNNIRQILSMDGKKVQELVNSYEEGRLERSLEGHTRRLAVETELLKCFGICNSIM